MLGKTSNIYVSITASRDGSHENATRKPHHTWMISVEPHQTMIPGVTGNKHKDPVHYAATKNSETGLYTINTHEIATEPAIIGNILIAESVSSSAEDVHQALSEHIGPSSPVQSSKPFEEPSDDEPEQWIRKALRALQERKIVGWFEVDEFMMYAHGYMANRMEGERPALIAYPKTHDDHEKKSSKHKFWVSHPNAHQRTKTNRNGEAMTYGGLM